MIAGFFRAAAVALLTGGGLPRMPADESLRACFEACAPFAGEIRNTGGCEDGGFLCYCQNEHGVWRRPTPEKAP